MATRDRRAELPAPAVRPDDGSPRASLHIDWSLCDGRGLCTELLPEQLSRDDWGYPLARTAVPGERSNVPVPASAVGAARDAVALCPRQALRLTVSG